MGKKKQDELEEKKDQQPEVDAAQQEADKEAEKARLKAEKEKEREEKLRRAELDILRKQADLADGELCYASDESGDVDVISTGHVELDKILTPDIYEQTGKGGIPRGHLCEFFGPYSGGKTSLSQMVAATVTKAKGKVAWVDAENSYVKPWAERQGVDNDLIIMLKNEKPTCGEWYLDKLAEVMRSGKLSLAVIDSVAALSPKAIMDTPLEENARMGAAGAMWSRALQTIIPSAKAGNCAVILINQTRDKIGTYGNPEDTPGGKAIKYYAVLRVRLSQVGKKERGILKDGEEIGIRSHITVVKSKFGPPYKECVLPIYFTSDRPKPIDLLIDLAIESKVIKHKAKKGEDDEGTFTLEGVPEMTGIQGVDALRSMMNVAHAKEIIKRLEEKEVKVDEQIIYYVNNLDPNDPLGDLAKTPGKS